MMVISFKFKTIQINFNDLNSTSSNHSNFIINKCANFEKRVQQYKFKSFNINSNYISSNSILMKNLNIKSGDNNNEEEDADDIYFNFGGDSDFNENDKDGSIFKKNSNNKQHQLNQI
ncbi:hypothetical protein ACTA71_009407 [Dictyostelium dimigraforme]